MRKPNKKTKLQCLDELQTWVHANRARISALAPDFRQWMNREIEYLRDTINSGNFSVACLSAHARHVARSLERMEQGEIVAIIEHNGFQLAGATHANPN